MNLNIRKSYLEELTEAIETIENQIGTDEKIMTDGRLFRTLYFLRDLQMINLREITDHDVNMLDENEMRFMK